MDLIGSIVTICLFWRSSHKPLYHIGYSHSTGLVKGNNNISILSWWSYLPNNRLAFARKMNSQFWKPIESYLFLVHLIFTTLVILNIQLSSCISRIMGCVVAHIYRVSVYVYILRIYRTSPYPSHFSGYGLSLSKTVKDPWYWFYRGSCSCLPYE